MSTHVASLVKTVALGATTDMGAGAIRVHDEKSKMMTSLLSKDGQGVVWSKK